MHIKKIKKTGGLKVMGLDYELKTLDGLEEGTAAFYKKVGDVYRLDVDGIDTAEEVKKALVKERDARKEAERKASEYKTEREKAETEKLEKAKEFEKLWSQEKEKRSQFESKLNELQNKIAEGEREKSALNAVSGLTKDTSKANLLKKEALSYIKTTPEGIVINGPNGEDFDTAKLTEHLTQSFPYLVDGSPAGGGGSQGDGGAGSTQKTINRTTFEKLSPPEKSKFVKDGGRVTEGN